MPDVSNPQNDLPTSHKSSVKKYHPPTRDRFRPQRSSLKLIAGPVFLTRFFDLSKPTVPKLGGDCAILPRARFNDSYQPLAELPGFTRGLDFCGRYAFVGLSQVRESAVFSGIQIAERPQAERFCGVWVIDIVTGEIVAWVKFEDALQEIFAVCVVPNRRWPEITNSNIGLISNSFVLPEEVLDTVPSDLLKRVPVVTGSVIGRNQNGSDECRVQSEK